MQNPSYVLNVETTGETDPIPAYRTELLKHCRVEWLATRQLYESLDEIEHKDKVFQLEACRTRAWFVRNRTDGSVRVAANSCRLRWCPLCSRARTNYIRHEVQEWFQTANYPKFLTVTVKHTQQSLTDQINHIYGSFQKFRKDKYVKKHCTGGIWFFQLCYNSERGEWHPHIHSIVTGDYMPYKKLRSLWKHYTKDSEILDIRPVRDPKVVGSYVARYAARPCQLSSLPRNEAIEAMTAMHGRRMAGSWGSARCISFRPRRIPDPENWEYLGSWGVVNGLGSSDERAKAILKAYYCNLELGEGNSCYEFDAILDDIDWTDPNEVEIDPKPPPTLFEERKS